MLPIAADYPFLEVFWTIVVFFAWVAWIWIVITVFVDIFRRHDIGGWGKAGVGGVRDRCAVPRRPRLSDRPARRDAGAQPEASSGTAGGNG